jgi:dTDP-4-amino-4,6-dideoxygalactose transaminase
MKSANYIPFNKPSIVGREFQFLEDAFRRGQLSGDGFYTKQCNARISELTGSATSLLTHSCTAALEMAAILCALEPGDEVIMPSFTFVSTANAVVLRGAVPVFVDIEPNTLNLDPLLIEDAITSRTRAIFAVHYAGFPADMDRINQVARTKSLMVVEDAAQALGSTYKGRPAGALGDMAAFSFHETKNIISGEGGAITLNRPDLVERAEIIREKGTNRSRYLRGYVDKYTWVDVGSSFLPGELVAAFLCAQLEREELIRNTRLQLFNRYMRAFSDFAKQGRVALPSHSEDVTGNGHMFYLLLRDIEDRDALISHLRAAGIVAPFHYVPLHSAPGGRRFGRVAGDLSVTDATYSSLMRLPLYFTLGDGIDRVIEVTQGWLIKNS